MVSGSISLLCSRFFSPFLHSTGSLSVSREYLALRDGPRGFTQNSSCSGLLRILLSCGFDSLTRLSLSLARLSNRFGFSAFCYVVVLLPQLCRNIIGLGSSAFARHYLRNHYYFLFLRVLRCFSSPGWPGFKTISLLMGYPIRKSTDQRLFAPPRGLSQLITSFVASESQGIPHTPFVTFVYFVPCGTNYIVWSYFILGFAFARFF